MFYPLIKGFNQISSFYSHISEFVTLVAFKQITYSVTEHKKVQAPAQVEPNNL